jgi:hypothetical protein
VGVSGLYIAYAGIRDVPLVDGLRSLLRGERPAERTAVFEGIKLAASATKAAGDVAAGALAVAGQAGDTGIDRLVGNAALAYPVLKRAFPGLRMGGWRAKGSVPSSDHPKGLAIDVMTGDEATAQRVIKVMRATPGLRLWIWNRHYASTNTGWRVTPCGDDCGPSAHTDHVHGSWT